MRLTIERLRALVLVAAALLLVATIAFLAIGKWKNPFNRRDLPARLGLDIQQESNGVTFSHALGDHAQFKIHASKVVQLRQDNAILHDVKIDLYGEDGSRVGLIEGDEFEYDQKSGTATAQGPVSITLMRPGTAPAVAPKAALGQALSGKADPLNSAARAAAAGEIHVKTSGLTFNRKSGIATTAKHVDFSTAQGNGSATGATYDAKQGQLVLSSDVQLHTLRSGDAVTIRANHAEFERSDLNCHLRAATASYRNGQVAATEANIEFRENGSAVKLDAMQGFRMTSANGSKLESPHGVLEFDERNQPRHGRMEGGVKFESSTLTRRAHGSAPTAEFEFTSKGDLRHAHLEHGVELLTDEDGYTTGAHPGKVHIHRAWHSPTADVEFRASSRGQVEPASIHGVGGVTVSSQSQQANVAPALIRLSADQVDGLFGTGSALKQLNGTGHASMEQTMASGARQTATGERLEARFGAGSSSNAVQIQTAELNGHVTLVQQAAQKPGASPQLPLRAFAGHVVYASDGQWLHLAVNPRIDNAGLQLTANRIDLSQDSGDAFAHGNVKATWTQTGKPGSSLGGLSPSSQEPAHVIAAEAQLHQTAGNTNSVATFRGHARLWQQANTVSAPTIVLEKDKETLEARSSDRAEPVRVVMLTETGKQENKPGSTGPSMLRVRGGELHYSGANRSALMQGGSLGLVVAETGSAVSRSDQVELKLVQTERNARQTGQSQVERMIARGHVLLSSEGRRGTGEQLTYTGANGEYVLTGTPASQPRISDPTHGSVSGSALIFRSGDDSVRIEGGGRGTTTNTRAPR